MKKVFKAIVFPFQFVFSRKIADKVVDFLIKYPFVQYLIALLISAAAVTLLYYIQALA